VPALRIGDVVEEGAELGSGEIPRRVGDRLQDALAVEGGGDGLADRVQGADSA
jgi:hypothetical protein